MAQEVSAEKLVKDLRRQTRRRFTAEEKIRIVLEGLRGEESVTALGRREGIAANLYYRWSKEVLEAGKKQLLGDTKREATSAAVTDLRRENSRLKELVAETLRENRVLKKSVTGFGHQHFIHTTLPKIRRVREIIEKINPGCDLEVDGGIDTETAPLVVDAGANVLVAGSAIFADDRGVAAAMRALGAAAVARR